MNLRPKTLAKVISLETELMPIADLRLREAAGEVLPRLVALGSGTGKTRLRVRIYDGNF